MRKSWIFSVSGIFLGVVFVLLVVRVFWLQQFQAETYRDNSRLQQHTVIIDPPRRGIIIDGKRRVAAASNKVNVVFAEPGALRDVDTAKSVSITLQNILDMPGHEICRAIFESHNSGYVRIKSGITPEQRKQIVEARSEGKLKGVGVQTQWVRHYPMGQLMGHLVGFVDSESIGKAGVEMKYDEVLKGSEGKDVLVVDVARKPIGAEGPGSKAIDGSGLILTIDSAIQQFVREELIAQYKKHEAESAVAIVMDPWTGGILAMVSVPDYDPENIKSEDIKNTLRNRCLTDPFEPGSIFKPIIAAIALDVGSIGYTDQIYCEKGDYRGKGFGRIGEWDNHQFGNMTVRDILAESSNIGMAKIGQKMGKKKMYDGVKLFGFGRKTGIDLPGEDAGVVRDPGKWDGYSVTRIPFGHEISVTAMQIARAYCVMANGGRMVKPHIVKG
ncbi:MAG: penicillin-binding protein 2, partial [Anaerohalosphaera sp.]|nr:penicillin-binding protein 2 [Anaerohalosphaera sp.]